MQKNLIILITLTFLLGSFAGCVAQEPNGDANGGTKGDPKDGPASPPREGTGAIEVTVTNDLFDPLEGANVTLHEARLHKTTNADGKALFSNLEPGRYTVFVSRLGFMAAAKSFPVHADQKALLNVTLTAVPSPTQPYKQPHQWDGFISCAIGMQPAASADLCSRFENYYLNQYVPPIELDANAQSSFEFPIDQGATAASLRLEEDTSGINQGGTYEIWFRGGPEPSRISGHSPLQQDYEFTDEDKLTQSARNLTVEVRAYGGDAIGTWNDASMFVWQKGFKVYLTMFYNGEPKPEDYNPKSEYE